MANLLFKRGTQASLDTIIKNQTAQDGAFYFTTDTNRLYIGNGDNTAPKLLNQAIQTVNSQSDLTNATIGDFYYVKDKNVLAFYLGEDNWSQINAQALDTNDDTYVSGVKNTSVTPVENGLQVSFTLEQKEKDCTTGDEEVKSDKDVTVAFVIPTEGLLEITGAEVGLSAQSSNNDVIISTSGAGADTTTNIKLVADENIDLEIKGSDIAISANDTTYTLGIDENKKLTLVDSENNSIDIGFSGDDSVTIEGDSNTSSIKVAHTNYEGTEKKNLESIELDPNPNNNNNEFSVVNKITTKQGHITEYEVSTFKLPDTRISGGEISIPEEEENKGSLKLSLQYPNNDEAIIKGTDLLYFELGGNKVYNQDALDVYTKSEIETKLKAVNSMTYKGTLGKDDENTDPTITSLVNLKDVQNGDTYKVISEDTYLIGINEEGEDEESLKVFARIGDLFIATGEENTNGYIDEVEWTYIPSGETTDTTYTLQGTGNKIILKDNVTNDTQGITVQGDGVIIPTLNSDVFSISHSELGTITHQTGKVSSGYKGKIHAIDSLNVNEYGHITGYSEKEYTLPDVNEITMSLEDTGIKLTNSQGDVESTITFEGGTSIVVSGDNDKLTIKHDTLTLTNPATENKSLEHEDEFTVLTGVIVDGCGHTTSYSTTKYTLPEDQNTTYSLSGALEGTNDKTSVTFTQTLTADNNDTTNSTFAIETNTLNIDTDATNLKTTIDLVWGTF